MITRDGRSFPSSMDATTKGMIVEAADSIMRDQGPVAVVIPTHTYNVDEHIGLCEREVRPSRRLSLCCEKDDR